MKHCKVGNCDADVIGSQSHLCGRCRETGSGGLFRDTGMKAVQAATFALVVIDFKSLTEFVSGR